jgi:membrane protease YdiL (CAAX protease family)
MTDFGVDARVLAGPLTAALLFAALAQGRVPRARVLLRPGLAVRWGGLAVGAALEELVWRGIVLGGLAAAVGPLPALAISSLGFAVWHWPSVGRRCLVHVATGGAFGAACLLGGLATAVVAHAVYNLLVDWAVLAHRREAAQS